MRTRRHNKSTHLREGEALSVNPVLPSLKQLIHIWLDRLNTRFVRWTRPLNTSLRPETIADLGRSKSELMAEDALLRQQLIILKRQVKRQACTNADRLLLYYWQGWSGHGNKCSSSFNQKHFYVGIMKAFASFEGRSQRQRQHKLKCQQRPLR